MPRRAPRSLLAASSLLLLASLAAALGVAPPNAQQPAPQSASESASDPVKQLRAWLAQDAAARGELAAQPFATQPLNKAQAKQAQRLLWEAHVAQTKPQREAEWNAKAIELQGKRMKWETRTFGEAPKAGHALYISLHGGGGAPPEVNEGQWRNQIDLYRPAEGIYIAPRAPTDTWNLWHEDHMDALLDRLIEDAVLFAGVDTDHVYVMGYSAGGDGVYQLAPRMADRWAAASMMAGHPGDADARTLRNLPFSVQVGERDGAYDRNKRAAEFGAKLADLQEKDPKGYEHVVKLYPGKGHWMDRLDAEAVPWMAKHARAARPKRVVWVQDDALRPRLYWLVAAKESQKQGALLAATIKGQRVEFDAASTAPQAVVLLDDALLDLDKPVTIAVGDRTVWQGTVPRRLVDIAASLAERADPKMVFPARVPVELATINEKKGAP